MSFNIHYPPIYARVCQAVFFLQYSQPKPLMHLSHQVSFNNTVDCTLGDRWMKQHEEFVER